MTIAEKMLELLDDESKWTKGALSRRRPGEAQTRRCLLGARLAAEEVVAEVTLSLVSNTAACEMLKDDPVMAAMTKVIREQYPDIADGFYPPSNFPPPNTVMGFNDWGGDVITDKVEYEDIRKVIEKVIAEGL